MDTTEIREVTSPHAGDVSPADEWTRTARRELIRRVMQSPSFARSERLSSLLLYVCDMTLKGREAELNEQRIGHAVFGRRPDYDSSNDGIVRTQASRLRYKLNEYFAGEGAGEPIHISIPKGGYVPVFTEQRPPTPQEEPEAATPDAPGTRSEQDRSGVTGTRLPWFLCAAFAVIAGLALWRTPHTQSPPPHPLWGRVFTAARPTLEVPGDSGLVLSYAFTHKGVSLSEYIAGAYRMPAPASAAPTTEDSIQRDLSNRRYTSIVDLEIAVNLQRLATSQHSSMQVRYARDLRPNDLKSSNAVLIGAFEGNPWLEMFEPRMKFQMVNDYRQHLFSVLNRTPVNGEPARWVSAANDPQRRVYGVIALLPNLSGDGTVLIVEGTSMAGVEAAWDFVSDDEVLLPLLHTMQRKDGSLPSFEILVGTQNTGASAVHADLIAWTTH